MKAKFIKTADLDDLKANLKGIIERYESSEPWLNDYFGHEHWFQESGIHIPEEIDLLLPDAGNTYDLENAKTLYSALKHIPLTVAIDERFWAYFTHVVFWNYMRLRWPVEKAIVLKEGATGYLKEHYFFMPNKDRALIRNGIARLWWYGHVSYDESRDDPFQLTRVLLEKLDIAQQLLERSYSRNQLMARTILEMLHEGKENGNDFSVRPKFRPLMMHLNALGGVTILDALDEEDIRNIVTAKLKQLDAEEEKETKNAIA